MKKFLLLMLVILVLILFALSIQAEEVIKIGAIAARTGNNAALGQWQRDGAMLAVEEINAQGGVLGRKLELVLEDSQGVPAQAVSVLNKLIYRDNVDIVIGDIQSSPSLAMLPVVKNAGIPLLVHGTSPKITKQGNEWVFRTRPSDTIKFGSVARFVVRELGKDKIAIFHDSAEYGVGGADAVEEGLAKLDVKPVVREQWTPGDIDFSSQLLKIKNSNAEVIILIGQMVDMGLVMKQARQMNINTQFVGGSGIENQTTIDASGGAAEGVIFGSGFISTSNKPKIITFVNKFEDKYGYSPNAFCATGYDSIYLAANAIKKAGTTEKNKVRDALRESEFDGIEGTYKFDKYGEGLQEVQFGIVKDGKPVAYK